MDERILKVCETSFMDDPWVFHKLEQISMRSMIDQAWEMEIRAEHNVNIVQSKNVEIYAEGATILSK